MKKSPRGQRILCVNNVGIEESLRLNSEYKVIRGEITGVDRSLHFYLEGGWRTGQCFRHERFISLPDEIDLKEGKS